MIIDHRYEVIESIGSGTWSNVYKVLDKRSGNIYALKLFQYLSSAELYNRFSAEEMYHITQIEHPNLAQVLDFGHVGDHIYYISEYFEGALLSNFKFKKNKLDLLYDIIVHIAYAIDSLHVQNIIHKDLKPENVLYRIIDNKVDVKVIDYGFSKIDLNKDQQNVTGSLPYISPEAYLNRSVSPANDFYALGVILYKLTTGSFPFSIDQINSLIAGSQHYFIPKFPSELNKDVPHNFEKLILKLLEKNPEVRINSSIDLIKYINRIQNKNYPFSVEWSLVNKIKLNNYVSRDNYCHQTLDYVNGLDQYNGKIVSLIGGDGLGKNSILSMLRYHLLTNKFFLFDYACSRTEHEPFFALIKEFMQSQTKEEITKYDNLANISEKFKRYLFESVTDAKKISQTQKELREDFESVRKILISLSEQKPIIFIIRNAQYIHRYTIEFINYISPFVLNHRILIILGFNSYSKIQQIKNSVIIQISRFTYNETLRYIRQLLIKNTSDLFVNKIWELSAGNPYFIREILIDLIQKRIIFKDNVLEFKYNFYKYSLPMRLINEVQNRLNQISLKNYNHLKYLSVVETPLNKELISEILGIEEKELYDFINEAVYNEILIKESSHFIFTYQAAKEKLKSETDSKTLTQVSKKVLKYYDFKKINDIEECKGIIRNAKAASEIVAERKYKFKLFELYEESYNQDSAYEAMLEVIKLDFNEKLNLPLDIVLNDLMLFQEKLELTGLCNVSKEVIKQIRLLPDIFEKYYILGTIYYILEQFEMALESFNQAMQYVVTGKQNTLVWLYLCSIYAVIDNEKAKVVIEQISDIKLPLDLTIALIDRKMIFLKNLGDIGQAIKTAEDFFVKLPATQDSKVMLRLASMHNNLGVCYSIIKDISEAEEHLNSALTIWKRFNVKRYLSIIYNNLADLYLKQGLTSESLSYSMKGYEIAYEQGLKSITALALLNMGEAYIKKGDFDKSEELLNQSQDILNEIYSKKFSDAIVMNLALAKSKIISFGYYYKFVSQHEPNLKNGKITTINPLIKTYFYYLFELGQTKKLKKMLAQISQLDYQLIREEEFYHNTQSLLSILNKDFSLAIEQLKTAKQNAGEVNNHYALTVFDVIEIECHIGLKNYGKAAEIIERSLSVCQRYAYNYWHLKIQIFQANIDLYSTSIPIRAILRQLINLYDQASKKKYYVLQIMIVKLIIQSFIANNCEQDEHKWLVVYKELLQRSIEGIDEDDKSAFLKYHYLHAKSLKEFDKELTESRNKKIKDSWNDLQNNLLQINDTDRISFFIDKAIRDLIAPAKYQILLYNEKLNTYSIYLQKEEEKESLLTPDTFTALEKAYKSDAIVTEKIDNSITIIIPLQLKYHRIGFILLSDSSELEFTKFELSLLRSLKRIMTNLVLRLSNYSELTQKMNMINKLMGLTHNLLKIIDIQTLEQEIVNACIDFAESSRGFLIKKDSEGNFKYEIAMDAKKSPLPNISLISKTVIAECQTMKTPIYTTNAQEDNRFRNSISVQDYKLFSIFCAPLYVDDVLYGLIYLDNFLDNKKNMQINLEIITLLFDQFNIAIKNAMQYKSIIDRSHELQSLESVKNEFMAIVSHELNTPLSSLQGYVSRLKRNLYSDEEEKNDLISKIESGVKKLILTTNDIMTMNHYNIINTLSTNSLNIADVINLIHHEIEIVSRNRKLFIKIEVSKGLPNVQGNWEAIHTMIYNVVLNAIRFTSDFGTIIIGARKSAFPQEKIKNKESIVVYVQDNGIGIPEHQLSSIFRKFYELNEIYAHKSGTIEYRSSGLGLGLSISKRIAELHDGDIWIKSRQNEGTTVFMNLPLAKK